MRIAWLSEGRVQRLVDGELRPWSSPFAESAVERALSIQRKNAWKEQGRGARFATWGMPLEEDGALPASRVLGLSTGRKAGELLYLLQCGQLFALLALEGEDELRLFHTADAALTGVSMTPEQDEIALCVAVPAGGARLALLSREGNRLREVTDGDVVDLAPRWAGRNRIVYQSAGIGRDANGLMVEHGPFEINLLDLDRGTVEPLATDPRYDLMCPTIDEQGALYYIRRPHQRPGVSASAMLGDLLLFPLRLARALLAWLDFFVVRYTGKPLITAGRRTRGPDEKTAFLLGNQVDVEKARRESMRAGDPVPALVPRSWELVRERDGAAEVLARGVLAFDVGPDGQVIYTNGSAVLDLDGSVLARDERIESVRLIQD